MATRSDPTVKDTQQILKKLGYAIDDDGKWGKLSQGALDTLVKTAGVRKLGWGQKFNDAEVAKLQQITARLGLPPERIQDFMACMAWETGETFAPDVKNPKSTATGLIQFMEATAGGMGTTTAKLAKMTVVEQLEYVYLHFKPYAKRIRGLGDMYMSIIWPKAVGQPDTYVMWSKADAPKQFVVNSGLDLNDDFIITRQECLHKVNNKLAKGFLPQYVRDI